MTRQRHLMLHEPQIHRWPPSPPGSNGGNGSEGLLRRVSGYRYLLFRLVTLMLQR
jgi:hypothetical protein